MEPLRTYLIPTVLLVALLTFVATWGSGADVRVAAGVAAGQILVLLGVGERVRARVTPSDYADLGEGAIDGEARRRALHEDAEVSG